MNLIMSTIFYNPDCSKCNQSLLLLKEHKIDPVIIKYLDARLSKDDLTHIISLGIPAKDLIRTHEDEWQASGLDIDTASDDEIIHAIIQHPIILQRPIVIANGKAIIGRPPEKVLEIL